MVEEELPDEDEWKSSEEEEDEEEEEEGITGFFSPGEASGVSKVKESG
jgi:hypothetical protein